MKNHPLLTPLKIGNETIANRLIVAPMAGGIGFNYILNKINYL